MSPILIQFARFIPKLRAFPCTVIHIFVNQDTILTSKILSQTFLVPLISFHVCGFSKSLKTSQNFSLFHCENPLIAFLEPTRPRPMLRENDIVSLSATARLLLSLHLGISCIEGKKVIPRATPSSSSPPRLSKSPRHPRQDPPQCKNTVSLYVTCILKVKMTGLVSD